jgi:hypothetical protein
MEQTKMEMKKNLAAFAFIASIGAAQPADAEPHAFFGLGMELCQKALTQDWLVHSETSWISGFLSAASMMAPQHNILPSQYNIPPNQTVEVLVGMVREECKTNLSVPLGIITEDVMDRLLAAQQPQNPKAPK